MGCCIKITIDFNFKWFINIFIETKKRWGGSVFVNTKWESRFLGRGDPIKVRYIRFEVEGGWHSVRHERGGWLGPKN